MKIKSFLVLLVLCIIGIGGIVGYANYYSPQKVLLRSLDHFTRLKTVHASMDITTKLKDPKIPAPYQDSSIVAESDINLQNNTQKSHMTLKMSGMGIDFDMILLKDGEMYMKMPFMGADWIQYDLKTLSKISGVPLDLQSNDYVSQSLAFLKSMQPQTVVKVGSETIDGERTTRYTVQISREKYLEHFNQLGVDSKITDQFRSADITLDLWINVLANTIVQTQSDVKNLTLSNALTSVSEGTADSSIKTKYSKYNQPVTIGKPEGKIIPSEELFKDAFPTSFPRTSQ